MTYLSGCSMAVAAVISASLLPHPSEAFALYPHQTPIRNSRYHYHTVSSSSAWRRPITLASSTTHVIQAPSMASVFGEDDDLDDDPLLRFPLFPETSTALNYLPQASQLPPQTKALVAQLSEAYVYQTRTAKRLPSLEQVLRVIEEEHVPIDVPLVIGSVKMDAKQTGDDSIEAVAEIFSLAAMYGLPKEITLVLIDGCIRNQKQKQQQQAAAASNMSQLEQCRSVFAQQGWAVVSFPKGLALKVRSKYQTAKQRASRNPLAFLKRRQRRVEQARQAVLQALNTLPPEQQTQSREDLLRAIEREITSNSGSRAASSSNRNRNSATSSMQLPIFFPNRSLRRKRIQSLVRLLKQQTARFQQSGRAAVVAYGFLNLCLYTVGVLWHWNRVALAENPFQTTSAMTTIVLRKLMTVMGTVCVASQFLRIPKIILAMCLTPVAQKLVKGTKKQLNVSETVATALLLIMQGAFWLGIVSVPALSEYTRLRRLVDLERLVNAHQSVAPAIYTVTMGVLQEC